MRNVSCVDQLSFAQPVTNVQTAAKDLSAGARQHQFWKTWEALGASPKVLNIPKEGYTLLFRTRPNLTRSQTIINCYANPLRNLYLTEALHALMTKNAVRNQGQTYQFKALPFGLFTAPMEFTVGVKEVKLMALHNGLRIHDCLVRARSHQTCLQHTQTLVTICQGLGWLENVEKHELDPKQVFNFIGYQFNLKEGKLRPTLDHWHTLTAKDQI